MARIVKKILKLAAFDFDHTIINPNSDTYIDKILLEKIKSNSKYYAYPDDVEDLHSSFGWTARMNAVFNYMHTKYNVNGKEILESLKEIKIDDSMIKLIKLLKQNGYELIILSDANTLFIETILKNHELGDYFSKIYTNEALIDSNGHLIAKPLNETYNLNSEKFKCLTGLCTENICKGTILRDHLNSYFKENGGLIELKHLIFIGDGRNDYCGGLTLDNFHHFCVRKNFNLYKLLTTKKDLVDNIKASIVYWASADDIIQNLNHLF